MAAITTVYLTFLGKGKHIVSHNALYGPARSVMETIFARFGVEYTYVDTTNIENVKSAIRPETAMIYTETPANPTMGISDLKKLADLAHEIGVPLVVDNTFCSPYLQRPIEFGADVVVHSMTKFLNGHADIVAGMIITANEKYHKLINPVMINMGLLEKISKDGIIYDGIKFTSSYVTGNTFSLDGVHITGQANAMVANEFIKAINSKYGSQLKEVSPLYYSGLYYY
jgi:methionine-gamma-lyase